MSSFAVFRGEDSLWYWRLKSANGEIVAQSEGYATRANARRGAKDAVRVAALAGETAVQMESRYGHAESEE